MTGHKEEIGQTLREARQAAGLTLKDIADAIRIRPIYLQAIEAAQFELLPALPQTVGFTRAYAKYLDVDVERPLSRLGEEVHETIGQVDYSEPEIPWTMVSYRRIAWVAGGTVLGLALAALLVVDLAPPPGEVAVASFEAEKAALAAVSAPRAVKTPVAGNVLLPSAQADTTAPLLSEMVSRTSPAEPPATVQQVSFTASGEPLADAQAAPPNSSVSGSNVAAMDPAPIAAPQSTAGSSADPHFVTGSVYVRSKPDNAGEVVGVLDACERIGLLGSDATNYWREVTRGDGSRGWVFRDYVSGEAPANCS
ncbi:MAG: helix-turn-helix domain-containing protein [Parvibaculum sp.]|uniref:helix-turn-helix domain-containing protein n=1 Tax=Parvibaculum sp. TaxID=2024848 RepID=UPI002AB824BE|nr:helix-turn-helix domain-containing protein [Parvibaculum sp.]MDZ4381425.1 helix-turn-helix domain-containing protein [Parvibaculum sp.]